MITEWNQGRVLEAVADRLVERGEIVGKFVETEARQRLEAIVDPEWGANYRRQVVSRLLTYVVVRDAQTVTVWVGVRTGPKGADHGLWIELGTASRNEGLRRRPGRPAHPFLRPAVFDNAREIVGLLEGR